MAEYNPIPDLDEVNAPRSHRGKDLLILLVAAGVLFFGLYFALGWIGERAALQISPEQERRWFKSLSGVLRESSKIVPATEITPILDRLVAGESFRFEMNILCDPEPNAMAVPGGSILLTEGLLKSMKSEIGLAFVIGHEMGHFFNRDHLKGLGRNLATTIGTLLFSFVDEASSITSWTSMMTNLSYDRNQEAAADQFALELVRKKYGTGRHTEELFVIVAELQSKGVGRMIPAMFSTHPDPEARIRKIRQATAQDPDLLITRSIPAVITLPCTSTNSEH